MERLNFNISKDTAKHLGLFALTILFCGCLNFLEAQLPKNELISRTVYSNATTANAAVTSMYSRMMTENASPYYFSMLPGLYSDELQNYSNTPDLVAVYSNNLLPDNNIVHNNVWQPAYSVIYQANEILAEIDKSSALNTSLVSQLKGEAFFTRAFWYYYLVSYFNDVPLVLQTSYQDNIKLSRASVELVYEQIISDLQQAVDLLNADYVDASGLNSSSERVRPNIFSASALLARVFLTKGNYSASELECNKVIENTSLYQIVPDIAKVFEKNSPETIWALQPYDQNGYNTPEGNMFILSSAPSTSTTANCTSISTQLLNAFDANDLRKTNWISSFDTLFFPFKYKVQWESTISEYSIVLRLAETFLIRAEARAQQGKLEGAKNDLNVIRERAGLSDFSSVSKDEILDEIYKQRRLELFCEWGHRIIDLKRAGLADQVMPDVSSSKGGSWTSYKQFFPIPLSEILNNSNISQNSGY